MKTAKTVLKCAETALAAAAGTLAAAFSSSVPAWASADAITNGVNQGTQKIWNILTTIVGPIGAVALAVCAGKMIWGSARSAEEAKNTVIKIIVAMAIVFLAPSIVSMISNWFSGSWTF